MTPGEYTLNWLRKNQLQVDDKWAEDLKTGFRWYPNQFAQEIEIVKDKTSPLGDSAQYIRIKTDVLKMWG